MQRLIDQQASKNPLPARGRGQGEGGLDRRRQALGRWGGLGGSGAPLTPQTNDR